MKYSSIIESIIRKAKAKVEQVEVFIVDSLTNKVDVLNQEIESSEIIKEVGLSIRVIHKNRLGFAYTSELEEDTLEETLAQALQNANKTEADEYYDFPAPANISINQDHYFDKEIENLSTKTKTELALKIENAAYLFDKRIKRTEKVTLQDSQSTIYLANNKGTNLSYQSNNIGGYISILAEDNHEWETGSGIDFVTQYHKFNPTKIGEEAAEEAISLINGKLISSQKIPAIISPEIGCQLLSALSNMFAADAVQKRKSLLINKLKHRIASKNITIIDHGNLMHAVSSSPFDAEGTLTKENILVENGILNNYLYDCYSANKDKTESTGNSSRISFKAPPLITPSNFYLKAGNISAEEIIRNTKKGILVLRLLGLHTINPISGEFSLGAAGVLIENGIKTKAVRGITIAGNILDLLEHIEEVANDLKFSAHGGNFGSPTFLINNLSISGEH